MIQYLASAGVGRLGLVDFDTVEVSNIQRQILHMERDAGADKIASAGAVAEALNCSGIYKTLFELEFIKIQWNIYRLFVEY